MAMNQVIRKAHARKKLLDGIGWIDKEKSKEPEKNVSPLNTRLLEAALRLGQKTTSSVITKIRQRGHKAQYAAPA